MILDTIWMLINIGVGCLAVWGIVEVFRFGYNKENNKK